jgi:putative chitinase
MRTSNPRTLYGLTTPNRLAEFLAETIHESAGYSRLVESLTYTSADRICAVWPSRFPTVASAVACVRNPQALAERVYDGRMGNTAPGDGWRFRRRGIMMLTGRANYVLYGATTGLEIAANPDLAAEPVRRCCWPWRIGIVRN